MGSIQRACTREGNRPARVLDEESPLMIEYNDDLYTVKRVFRADNGTTWYIIEEEQAPNRTIYQGWVDRSFLKKESVPEHMIHDRTDITEYSPDYFVQQGS